MGELKPCCAEPGNRLDGPGPRGLETEPPEGVTVTHCVECECRHFEVQVDPLLLNLTGSGL